MEKGYWSEAITAFEDALHRARAATIVAGKLIHPAQPTRATQANWVAPATQAATLCLLGTCYEAAERWDAAAREFRSAVELARSGAPCDGLTAPSATVVAYGATARELADSLSARYDVEFVARNCLIHALWRCSKTQEMLSAYCDAIADHPAFLTLSFPFIPEGEQNYQIARALAMCEEREEAIRSLREAVGVDSAYRMQAATDPHFRSLWDDAEFTALTGTDARE